MELKMNYNARGIRWIVLLTKDLTGLIVDGLGSGAYQRVDGRMRVDNILPIAEDKMKRANNFQNFYFGYRLCKGNIGNLEEVSRFIDRDLEMAYDARHNYKTDLGSCWATSTNIRKKPDLFTNMDDFASTVDTLDRLERKVISNRKDGYKVLVKEE